MVWPTWRHDFCRKAKMECPRWQFPDGVYKWHCGRDLTQNHYYLELICSHIETGVCYFLRNKSKTMTNHGCHTAWSILARYRVRAHPCIILPFLEVWAALFRRAQEHQLTQPIKSWLHHFPQNVFRIFPWAKEWEFQTEQPETNAEVGWSCRSRDIKDKRRFKAWPVSNLTWCDLVDSGDRLLLWISSCLSKFVFDPSWLGRS